MILEEYSLTKICNVSTGKKDANHASDDGIYRFYTCADKPIKSNTFSFSGESIILPGNGANVGLVLYYDGNFEAYQRTYVLNNFRSDVFPRYIYYHLIKWWKIKNSFSQYGSATNYIRMQNFEDYKIPLPPLNEQIRIAQILDKADEIRQKRKQAIILTEELLKSTFLEMFGDPVINPKGWEVKKLEDVALKSKGSIKSGPFGSQLLISELVNEGIPVYGIDNVQTNKFVWAKAKYITNEKYEQLKSFSIKEGDVLISRTGTVGRTCIAPPNIPNSIIGANLLKVSLNFNKVIPEYLSYALSYSNSLIEEIKRVSPGATVAVFNTTNLKNLTLAIPPIDLQSKFTNIIKQIEKHKEKQIYFLQESENLFNSLLQRAFKGEL